MQGEKKYSTHFLPFVGGSSDSETFGSRLFFSLGVFGVRVLGVLGSFGSLGGFGGLGSFGSFCFFGPLGFLQINRGIFRTNYAKSPARHVKTYKGPIN